ncbi:MAG: hypothetical protein ACU84J_05360 [Gammaproteobacteria bacterium]
MTPETRRRLGVLFAFSWKTVTLRVCAREDNSMEKVNAVKLSRSRCARRTMNGMGEKAGVRLSRPDKYSTFCGLQSFDK